MIATLLGWGRTALGFAGGIKLWLIAGCAVVLIVGFLWIDGERVAAERDLAQQQANDAIAVIESIQADRELTRKIVAERETKIANLEKQANDLKRKISAAPRTRACVDSPAIRTLLDSLRNEGAHPVR